jgi:lysophospholipase
MLDHLVPAPEGVPALPDGETTLVTTSDGFALRAAFFRPAHPHGEPLGANSSGTESLAPTRAPRGTIILLQGRAEFIEKYGEVYAELLGRGFAVATLDWRGQGGSARLMKDARKGHIEDFEDYQRDLDALLAEARRRKMPEPYGLLAHSTGGAVALHRLAKGPSPFVRAILCAPLVEIGSLPSQRAARALARALSLLGMAGFYIPFGKRASTNEKPFAGNILTHDARRFAWARTWSDVEDQLALGDPTIGWVEAAFESLADFTAPDFGQKNRTPLLMLLGGEDRVTEPRAAADLATRMRGASSLTISGARHEILFERDAQRAAFWAAFDAFMVLAPTETTP